MPPLAPEHRRDLERAVVAARGAAEAGARAALEALAVHHHEPYAHMARPARDLRNALRAHARQLGDRRDPNRGTQAIDRLVQECAYEHWHRMLFARFLAENDLLIEAEAKVSVSLDECRELAREQGVDPWELASRFAQHMLPAIFRPEDPVLQVSLSREDRMRLEGLLEELPAETFRADDSLGWVYQFWQTQRKEEVNASGDKIGADELPAVTQLFTEHYMVLFLLHNTLGAWHAARVLASRPELAKNAKDEGELRDACALPGYAWDYLRFVRDEVGPWRPAAGTYEGWPQRTSQITVMDPCCGSGHFLVAVLEALMRLRMHEEGLSLEASVPAVLKDNLNGLEIEPRCTQLAGFAVAFAAWRALGRAVPLPAPKIACSGLAVGAKRDEWVALAGKDERLQTGMKLLYDLFGQAPTLGSLIDPKRVGTGDLLVAEFHELRPLLERALAGITADVDAAELAVTAAGLAQAAELLTTRYTLVVTNVPYLARGKQDEVLKEYCERNYPQGRADLATCFVERCLEFSGTQGSTALVTPQNWLFLIAYKALRERLLRHDTWNLVARLGAKAFQTPMWDFNVVLVVLTHAPAAADSMFAGCDVGDLKAPGQKDAALRASPLARINQHNQLGNPDMKVMMSDASGVPLLSKYAASYQGLKTGDDGRVRRAFWEVPVVDAGWRFLQSTVDRTTPYGGLEEIIDWRDDGEGLARRQGVAAWDSLGVMVSQMGRLPVALYLGTAFDSNASPVVPKSANHLPAIWAFCASAEYHAEVRKVDQSLKPTNTSLVQVPFDLDRWEKVAMEAYPRSLPKPWSTDPTQWIFGGHPRESKQTLQVAVARLLGYRWPRQTGSSFQDCQALGPDDLESLVDADGIACLSAVRGEEPAAKRLQALIRDALGAEWSAGKEHELIAATGSSEPALEEWLRDEFFAQHIVLFQHRPFVWHIWDGRKDGFHALVNYHRLAEPHGHGRKVLESLVYSYLGDWIARQKAAVEEGEPGAEDRLDAAQELQSDLVKILEGEPPYDIFVRWKPLQEQPVGWEPDINDGVRVNIRPFMSAELSRGRVGAGVLRWKPNIKWDKDRGKESERPKDQYPWFWSGKTFTGERWNDRHLTRAEKMAARDGWRGAS